METKLSFVRKIFLWILSSAVCMALSWFLKLFYSTVNIINEILFGSQCM